MRYRVKTPDGELEFASEYDIERAYARGLLDETDEVLDREKESVGWRKIAAIPAIRQAKPPTPERARGLTPRLVVVTLIFALGALGALVNGRVWVAIALSVIAGSLGMGLTYLAFKPKT